MAARFVGKRHQLLNELRFLFTRRGKQAAQAAEGADHGGQRELQHDRAHGAAKNNQGGRRLQDLAHVAAFNRQSEKDSGEGQKRTYNARFIHILPPQW